MTCCVAALADDSRTLVLAADRMFGTNKIEGEPDIRKIVKVHPTWWMLYAGDVGACIDVIGRLKKSMSEKPLSVGDAAAILGTAVWKVWNDESEANTLKRHGWTISSFRQDGATKLPSDLFRELDQRFALYDLNVQIVLAGFDSDGQGHILSMDGYEHEIGRKLQIQYRDIPGYHSIGNGSDGALYMMNYKDVSHRMSAREVLYYALEGKYFGELARGVGWNTDIEILRPDSEPIVLDPEYVDAKLIELCKRHTPRLLGKASAKNLNELAELAALPTIDMSEYESRRRKRAEPLHAEAPDE